VNPILIPVVALAVSMMVIPLMMRVAPALGFLDKPSPRKVHATPVARVGGWGIVIGALAPVALALDLADPIVQGYVAGGLVLWAFGSWDDSHDLSPYVKLVGQLIAASLVVVHGGLVLERVPFLDPEPLPGWIGTPLTVLAVVAVTNAMNLSDGLDGLAGGEAVLSLIAIVLLGYLAGGERSVLIGLAAIGSTLGFLRYNTYPARIFMGDSGSQFLGFTVAVVVLLLSQVANTALGAAVPLLLIGLPAVDLVAVVTQRTLHGIHWFRPSRTHLHHRLLDLGFAHYQAVIAIYAVQGLFVVTGVALRYAHDALVIALYLAYALGIFALVLWAKRAGWQASRGAVGLALGRWVTYEQVSRHCRAIPVWVLGLGVPLYLVGKGFVSQSVPRDFGLMSAVLFAVLAVELLFRRTVNSITTRGVVYATAMFAVYLSAHYAPAALGGWSPAEVGFFGAVALAVAVAVRCADERAFRTTPMDYLMVLVVIALLALPPHLFGQAATTEIITKGIVLLYASEIFLQEVLRRWNPLTLGAAVALGTMAVRGLA
jgi:UDP-GlcNAc:undecaprenyl-phosphate GlcNAc-1-phosphate transferase